VDEFHGLGKCDCCLKDNVFCNSFNDLYKQDGFNIACEACGSKISKAGKLAWGKKEDWQVWSAKAMTLKIRADSEKSILNHNKAIERAAKSPFFLKWCKLTGDGS